MMSMDAPNSTEGSHDKIMPIEKAAFLVFGCFFGMCLHCRAMCYDIKVVDLSLFMPAQVGSSMRNRPSEIQRAGGDFHDKDKP